MGGIYCKMSKNESRPTYNSSFYICISQTENNKLELYFQSVTFNG